MVMARKIGEIDLDPKRERFEGFQEDYCPWTVRAMQEGIRLGHKFPRVDVTLRNGVYQMVYGEVNPGSSGGGQYGGHNRTYSHIDFPGQVILRCNLFSGHRAPLDRVSFIPFEKMISRDIPSYNSLDRALGFLPDELVLKVVKSLCRTHGLDPKNFLNSSSQ